MWGRASGVLDGLPRTAPGTPQECTRDSPGLHPGLPEIRQRALDCSWNLGSAGAGVSEHCRVHTLTVPWLFLSQKQRKTLGILHFPFLPFLQLWKLQNSCSCCYKTQVKDKTLAVQKDPGGRHQLASSSEDSLPLPKHRPTCRPSNSEVMTPLSKRRARGLSFCLNSRSLKI